jgi:hypothetical protein
MKSFQFKLGTIPGIVKEQEGWPGMTVLDALDLLGKGPIPTRQEIHHNGGLATLDQEVQEGDRVYIVGVLRGEPSGPDFPGSP